MWSGTLPLLLLCQTADAPGPHPVDSDLAASFALPSETLTGHLYWPTSVPVSAVPVVVGHGFARTSGALTGWGAHLASHGMVVAVPDFPNRFSPDHELNATLMQELVTHLRSRTFPVSVDQTRFGLIGHSAGGLSTLIAASREPTLSAAVGLDPVDADGLGAAAAGSITAPLLILGAEASSCNAQGSANTLQMSVAAMGSWFLRVVGSTHCDGEDPSNGTCTAFCGGEDPARRALYRRYTTAHLLRHFDCGFLDHQPGGAQLSSDVTSGVVADLMTVGTAPGCGGEDAGVDAGLGDAADPPDADVADAQVDDRGQSVDAGEVPNDAGRVDVGDVSSDAGAPAKDAGPSRVDAGLDRDDDSGCGCAAGPEPRSGPSILLLLLLGLLTRRRPRHQG